MGFTSTLLKQKENVLSKKYLMKQQSLVTFFLFIFYNLNILSFLVNYKVELHDPRSGGFMPSSPGIGMHVQVKDPDDKLILSRVYSSEGNFYSHN